jgi:hypothetical protein
MLNINDLKETYKFNLKANILGQSKHEGLGWLRGVEDSMYFFGLEKEYISQFIKDMKKEVFDELTNQGYGKNVELWTNEQYSEVWGDSIYTLELEPNEYLEAGTGVNPDTDESYTTRDINKAEVFSSKEDAEEMLDAKIADGYDNAKLRALSVKLI